MRGLVVIFFFVYVFFIVFFVVKEEHLPIGTKAVIDEVGQNESEMLFGDVRYIRIQRTLRHVAVVGRKEEILPR